MATSLLDQTVINILIMLRLQQVNHEYELMQQRDSMIAKVDGKLNFFLSIYVSFILYFFSWIPPNKAKRNNKIEQVEKKFSNGEITLFKRDELLKVCLFVIH